VGSSLHEWAVHCIPLQVFPQASVRKTPGRSSYKLIFGEKKKSDGKKRVKMDNPPCAYERNMWQNPLRLWDIVNQHLIPFAKLKLPLKVKMYLQGLANKLFLPRGPNTYQVQSHSVSLKLDN
jgi:hypothetical protein